MKYKNDEDSTGLNIKKIRHEKGLTQEDLAKAAGITIKSLSQIENSKTQARRSNLRAIAEALGCSTTELTKPHLILNDSSVPYGDPLLLKMDELKQLLSLVSTPLRLPQKEHELLSVFRKLSSKEQNQLLKLAKQINRKKRRSQA